MSLTFGTFCSGIEAASEAWLPLGWECLYVAEIEPFPCAYLHQVHGAGRPRYMPRPETAENAKEAKRRAAAIRQVNKIPLSNRLLNLGDISQVPAAELPRVDILGAGFPCFPAGTLISTRRGFVPIEEVVVGDEALTHQGRFRRVCQVGSKTSETFRLSGQGHDGLVTTANHPFLSRKKGGRGTRRNGKAIWIPEIGPETWTQASDMRGRHWACVAEWPELEIPPIEMVGQESRRFEFCADLFRLVGAYLGDGWARTTKRRGTVTLGLNAAKLEKLKPTLDALGAYSANPERTVVKVVLPSRALARWLITNFGTGASEKSLPMWTLGMPLAWRAALLEGYLITDGTPSQTSGMRASSVSHALALTMRMLANSLGYASSVTFHRTDDTCVIEGRTVNQKDYWTVTASPSSRTSFAESGRRWQLVRAAEPTGIIDRVYDLTVEDDHSYVADGIVVHNCQDFSIAGLRASLSGARGNLSTIGVRLILEAADLGLVRGAVLEQVPDVLNTEDNAWGNIVGALVGADDALEGLEHGGKWPSEGLVEGPRARVAWGILDAQYWGLAQRRERVWLIVDFGDGPDPAAVLFDAQSLLGNPPSRPEPFEGAAPTLAGGARERGGYSYDDIPQVASALRAQDGAKGVDSDATDTLIAAPEVAGTLGTDMDRGATGQQARAGLLLAFGGNNCSGPIDVATARTASHTASHTASGRQDFETETFIAETRLHAPSSCAVSGCGLRLCINPQHQRWATREENMADAIAHGTTTRGERHGAAKLTEPQVLEIKAFLAAGQTHERLAVRFGVARNTITDIAKGKNWAWLGSSPVPFSIMPMNSGKDYKAREVDIAQPLMASGPVGGNQGGDYVVAFNARQDPISGPVTGPLDTDATQAVAFSLRGREGGAMPEVEEGDVSPALRAADGGSTRPFIAAPMAVRRITVVEAEILQGFAPNRTLIHWPSANRKGVDLAETIAYLQGHGLSPEEAAVLAQTPDGPRYRAIGNSWPIPVVRWLGQRIAASLPSPNPRRTQQ